ncbi:MAG: TraR/DksA family transcriptional regulator [Chitinophagaceae bacterium]|nr:MAG: TraR/DksA family transcriptional regulator [Chitinophagaceae bacterium]
MANKKKPVPKKASKPAPKAAKAAKPAAKKPAAKKAAKPAPAKAKPAKPAVKAAKPAPKPAVKKAEPAKKPAPAKPVAVAKPEPKPVAAKPAEVTPPPVVKKSGAFDPQSLVSIKPTAKPVIKKEPPRPSKIVIPKTTVKSAVKYEPEFTKSVLDTPMQEHTGPTMRYSDADLNEFREIINKKLDAAKKELAYLQGLITRRDEGGDMDEARYMTMEDGSVSMEREQLSQMASRQITFIDHLEKAIMRIENKTYGVCRVTGKLIDKARLRAVPHATLSIEAKQMMNK